MFYFGIYCNFYNPSFQFKKNCQHNFIFAERLLVRDCRNYLRPQESIEGDEHTTVSFRTIPEIMADVSTYDPKELLIILFDHVANFLSIGSGWRFDSIQSLAISLCPFRTTVGAGSYIEHQSPYIVKDSLISKILKTIIVSSGAFSRIFIE